MLNRVVLTGRLTRDPELRYTGNGGVAVCSFRIAVDRQYRNHQGERDADFINCTIWRKAAENFANFTHKGSLVGIDGRLTSSSYENQGQRIYRTEVTVDNFALLDSRNSNNRNGSRPNEQGGYSNGGYQAGGFNNGYQSANNNFGGPQQNNAFSNNNAGQGGFANNSFGQQASSQPDKGQEPIFNQNNNVDLDTLPFGKKDSNTKSANSASGINIDDEGAFEANQNNGSSTAAKDDKNDHGSDDQKSQKPLNDIPF